MKNLGHSELETTEEDCGIEIVDLDPPDVTASSTSFWLASKLLQWQRSTCALCILLFITILFSLLRIPFSFIAYSFKTALYPLSHSSSTTSLPAPLPPPLDGIACLADSSWSLNSTSIAVLGYQDCPKNDYVSGLVNLYNARSRQMVGQLLPGDANLQALGNQSSSLRLLQGKQPSSGSTSGDTDTDHPISYEHVIWSPDNQRLAVTFEVTGQQSSVYGVWLADRNGQSVHVLLQQKQTTLLFYLEWDLNHLVNTPPSAALALKSLPLALVYHWWPNGQLVPETLLTNTTTVTTVTTVTNNIYIFL